MVGADVNILDLPNTSNGKYIFIYDNEKRNVEIVSRIEKSIELKNSIVIWPKGIIEKDINDLILSGNTSSDIEKIIKNNTFTGLEAKLKLMGWKRC